MLSKKPEVSIITPLYNNETYLEKTIKSVLDQTYSTWEMIIVDDCSTDSGPDIARSYADKDNRFKFFQLSTNSGAGRCRNLATEKARGKYIAFLDSDDCWYPEKLEKQLLFMKENGYEFTFTKYRYMNEDGKLLDKYVKVPARLSYKINLIYNPIGCLTVMYNAESLGKFYMPDIRRGQDYALWLKMLRKGKYAYGLNESLAWYRLREQTLSENKLTKFKKMVTIYNQEEKHGKIVSMLLAFVYSLYKLMKEKI